MSGITLKYESCEAYRFYEWVCELEFASGKFWAENVVLEPLMFESLFMYRPVYVVTGSGCNATLTVENIDLSRFVRWLYDKAKILDLQSLPWSRGLFHRAHVYYYMYDNDVLEIDANKYSVGGVNCISRAELMYKFREYWMCLCIAKESGKEYAESKWKSKMTKMKVTKEKAEKKLLELEFKSDWRKKKKAKKKLENKINNCFQKSYKPEAGVDAKVIFEAIEKLGGLFLVNYLDKPLYKAFAALVLLIRGSVTCTVFDILSSMCTESKSIEANLSDFVSWMKSLVVDIDKFKNNRFAKPFVRLVCKITTVILCPDLKAKVSKIFEKDSLIGRILDLFSSEFHPLESIVHLITYLSNAVDLFIKTGELTGFIETQSVDDMLITELREIRDAYNLFKTGDIEFIKTYKIYEFIKRLKDLKAQLTNLRKSRKALDLKEIDNWIREVDMMDREVTIHNIHHSTKMQGYYLSISSGSGISKGHLMNLFANTIGAANKIPHTPEYHYTLNQANQYQSGWSNATTIVKVDDAAAMQSTVQNSLCLADWLLRGSNNIPHELLGADISEKATLFNRALIEVWSSNSFDMFFHEEARFPSALHRRFQVKLVARVKKEYTKTVNSAGAVSSQIDYDKMDPAMRELLAPDAWEFTAYKCQIFDTPIPVKDGPGACKKEQDNDFQFVIVEHNGKKLENVSVSTILEFLIEDSKRHFKQQQLVLKMSDKLCDPKNYCPHGCPTGMLCSQCEVIVPESTNKLSELRTRVVQDSEYKMYHAKIFGPSRKEFLQEGEVLPYVEPNYDYVHNCEIKCFNKARLYKAIVSYKQGVFKVTRECNVDVVRTMPFADILIPECFSVIAESGDEKPRVKYMRSVLDLVKDRKIDTSSIWKDTSSVMELLVSIKHSLRDTLQTWFDTCVLDVLMMVVDKVVKYVEKFMSNPWSQVPTLVEGTIVGAYVHAKRPLVIASSIIDWFSYTNEVAQRWLDNPYAIRDIKPKYECTKFVYEKFLATPTKMERLRKEGRNPLSLRQFVLGGGAYVSSQERERKLTDPDLIRDTFLPAVLSCAAVMSFIPRFCDNFSSMYTEAEVGYMVSVDEIKALDKEEIQNWYKAKTEIMKNDVLVDETVKFTELENIVNKNTVYVLDTKTRAISCGVSPRNQFILLPGHFVKDSMNNVIEVTKVPHSTSPGNAKFQFCLTEKNVRKLPGDVVLVHVYQFMDHMRTKDIVRWFPLDPPTDADSGRLLYKASDGHVKTIDASYISFHEELNNENVMWNKPKNPFKGHRYSAITFQGLCGAPLIDHTHKKSCILGLHVGGRKSDSTGISCFVGRKELENALANWNDSCVVQEGGVTLESYGKELFVNKTYFKNPVLDTVDRIDNVELLGTVEVRKTQTSKVVYTPIYEDVKRRYKLEIDWAAPNFNFNGDKRHGTRSLYKTLSTKKTLQYPLILEKAVSDYKSRVKAALDKDLDFWTNELTLLTDHEIVNGKGVKYVSGMNMSSKFDAHLPGPKSEHAYQENGQWYFKDYVWKEFYKREGKMKQGVLTYELLVNALKNEATKKSAVEIGKVRNFFMCGTPFQMILRKYLQTTCRFFCFSTPFTECAVGINPHSTAWDKMFKEIEIFRYLIALDFRNFDLTTLLEILSEALDLIFFPRNYTHPPSQEERNVQKCIKHAIMFALCDVNGDVMILKAIIPSGINLTSIVGCIVNSINFRMAYYFLKISDDPFHTLCILRTFGDDSFGSTKSGRFTVRNILYAFSTMGIQATDMHKNEVSNVKFYKIEDIEFLKRKGRKDKDFGYRVAPLVDSSRFKMLCCHVPTKHMSIEAVTGQCIDNFLLESAFHGRKVYNKDQEIMKEIVKHNNLQRFCRTLDMSFDDRVKDWKLKYCKEDVLVTRKDERNSFGFSRLMSSFYWNSQNWFEWTQEFKSIHTCSLVSKTEDDRTRLDRATDQYLSVLNKVELEGLELAGYLKESGTQKEQVLTFVEPPEEESLVIGGSVPEVRTSPDDCSLQEFLARPVKIADYAWGSTQFSQQLDPWNALWNNKRIANRISNHKLFRGKCHVKMVVNGNGFYYGKIMVSYLPFEQVDNRSQFSPLVPLNRIPMSQCPHVFIDATTSQSCTMVLPFFYPADYVNLQADDKQRSLGSLGFYQIAGLRHANQDIATTLNNLTISVYAWFEDVELVGPTHLNIQGIVAQSGTEEESVEKPVSQACTAVASTAKLFTDVPFIGKYALAIEKGAQLTSTIASALGYSSPLDCVEPNRYQPRVFGNICVANTTDSAMKLTLDVKQDTTIDPSTVGLDGRDELAIQHIASRESFITTFDWDTTQAVNTLLYNFCVTPMMYEPVSPGTVNYITAICGATLPFRYWNGSIVFKFQVVCSANHKGRLAIVYDPNYTVAGASLESNIAYMEIVDISKNREFEITLHNHQHQQWLAIPEDWWGLTPTSHSSSQYTTFQEGSNGTLSIYVLNELTAPGSDPAVGNAITLASYIKAGDDFQVANPTGRMAGYQCYVPESGISETVDSNINIDHAMQMKERQMRVYQGERIDSFRMLLKRYQNYTRVSRLGAATGYNAWILTHQGFPAARGIVENIPYTGSNQVSYSYLQYLMGAFSGWKGGIRWKALIDLPNSSFMMSRRDPNTLVAFHEGINSAATASSKATEFAQEGNEATTFGGVWTSSAVNPSLEVEIPFYSQYKFVAGKPYNITQCFLTAYTQHWRTIVQKPDDDITDDHSLSFLVSAGEDFTFYFFSGFPPIECFSITP